MFSGVKISKYSKYSVSDDVIEDINTMIKKYDTNSLNNLTIDVLFLDSHNKEEKYFFHLNINNGLDPLNIIEIKYIELPLLKQTIQKYVELLIKQQSCQHEFIRDQHETGNVYYNGQARCKHCDFKKANMFPIKNHSQLCSISIGDKDYPTFYDWRTSEGMEIGIQCGEKGIVISRKGDNYLTAFFEAFPDIHGYGTFIRGEGKNLKEAEESAWQKYQKRLNCPKHEFSREVNGKHRSDGYGICIHCGLTSSEALEPETLCIETGQPTKNKFCGQYLSYDVYFSKKPIDAITSIIEYEKSLQNSEVKSLFSHGPIDGEDIVFITFDYMINQWAYRYFNYNHNSYEKDKYTWNNYINEIIRLYETIVLKIPMLFNRNDDFVYPEISISDLVSVCEQLLKQSFFEYHMKCFHTKNIKEVKETFDQTVTFFNLLLK